MSECSLNVSRPSEDDCDDAQNDTSRIVSDPLRYHSQRRKFAMGVNDKEQNAIHDACRTQEASIVSRRFVALLVFGVACTARDSANGAHERAPGEKDHDKMTAFAAVLRAMP